MTYRERKMKKFPLLFAEVHSELCQNFKKKHYKNGKQVANLFNCFHKLNLPLIQVLL